VLLDTTNEDSLIPRINPDQYEDLKSKQVIFAGMIPKLDNAFAALRSGVKRVIIGRAEELPLLLAGKAGTTIVND
jgi:acetylglutamate kinase